MWHLKCRSDDHHHKSEYTDHIMIAGFRTVLNCDGYHPLNNEHARPPDGPGTKQFAPRAVLNSQEKESRRSLLRSQNFWLQAGERKKQQSPPHGPPGFFAYRPTVCGAVWEVLRLELKLTGYWNLTTPPKEGKKGPGPTSPRRCASQWPPSQ